MKVQVVLEIPDESLELIAERAAALVLERQAEQAAAVQEWMSVSEAADYLRCRKQRIYELRSARALTPYVESGRALVKRTELEALIKR